MTFVVTRQTNFYDEGAPSVEIAYGMDNVSPGALSSTTMFPDDFTEAEDPREAVEVAIKLRKAWWPHIRYTSMGEKRYVPFTISGAASIGLYPTVEDGLTAAQLRRWAKQKYEQMPKCDYCGTPTENEYQDEFGDKFPSCSDFCASQIFDRHWETPE